MKQKKFLSLMMIALLLAGCDKKGNDSSTITPSGSDTVSETKPSASTSEKSPIASFLESLKAGYTRNFKLTYSNTLESVETEDGYLSSGEDSFSYFEPSYAFNGDIISEQMEFYEKGEGDSLFLCYLNFHNEVKKIPYTGAEKFSNYANAFLSAKETDFTKDGEDFSLSKDSASFARLASELKTSKDNLEFFKINLKDGEDSFSFKIKGSSDVSYETKLAEGTILTGKDNVIKVKPMEGREDPLFAKGREWINNGNYNRKSTFSKYDKDIGDFVPSAVYAREADKEHSIAITTYDGNGTMLAQSGLSKAENGDIQSCIVINEAGYYPDGKAIKGNLSSALVAPQISSLFFDKTYTSNEHSGRKVAVYQLKDSLPAYVFKEKFNYLDSFADDSMERKDLSIAISDEAEDEFIQIINENQSRRYRVLYSDFGMVDDPIRYTSINANCDDLTFGDYFTEDSFSVLKDDIFSLDVLQNIPAFGSYYANVSFIPSSESDRNLFEIKTTPATQKNIVLTDITSLRTSYEAKLVEAEYTKVENPSEDELVDASDTLYQKKTDVTYTDDNGEEQTITLKVEVSVVSEDDGPHLVLYPTYVEEPTEGTESIL